MDHKGPSSPACLVVDAGYRLGPQPGQSIRVCMCDPSMWSGLPHNMVALG